MFSSDPIDLFGMYVRMHIYILYIYPEPAFVDYRF